MGSVLLGSSWLHDGSLRSAADPRVRVRVRVMVRVRVSNPNPNPSSNPGLGLGLGLGLVTLTLIRRGLSPPIIVPDVVCVLHTYSYNWYRV